MSRLGRVISVIVTAAVVVSIVAVLLETMPEFRSRSAECGRLYGEAHGGSGRHSPPSLHHDTPTDTFSTRAASFFLRPCCACRAHPTYRHSVAYQ